MHLWRSSSNVPRLLSFLEMRQNPHVLLTFDKVHNLSRLPRETTSERPKVVRTWCVLYILTWKCASRHSGVHFCDIWTSKSGPRMVCFVHFDFEMCFAPQRRALFWHRNFQKWSEPGVFCTFWLRNVLRATTACTFLTSQLPKVVRSWCVLCTFWLRNVLRATTACTFSSLIWPDGSAPAALASLLFDPPEPQIIGKTQCFATFLPFRASASSFFWLFLFSGLLSSTLLFSLTLSISAFYLSILSEVWLLNFFRLLAIFSMEHIFNMETVLAHSPQNIISPAGWTRWAPAAARLIPFSLQAEKSWAKATHKNCITSTQLVLDSGFVNPIYTLLPVHTLIWSHVLPLGPRLIVVRACVTFKKKILGQKRSAIELGLALKTLASWKNSPSESFSFGLTEATCGKTQYTHATLLRGGPWIYHFVPAGSGTYTRHDTNPPSKGPTSTSPPGSRGLPWWNRRIASSSHGACSRPHPDLREGLGLS